MLKGTYRYLEMGEFKPIGFIQTCFTSKNGTPRQSNICAVSKGQLTISKTIFNNPEHSLDDLNTFSHVWLLFKFHLNDNKGVKAKVKPPRMGGLKTGVFASRSPHRPNAVGLTLAKLDKVEQDTIFVSGIDIVNDTPVIDIKPYIPKYDCPLLDQDFTIEKNNDLIEPMNNENEKQSDMCNTNIQTANWITKSSETIINVIFSERAKENLRQFVMPGEREMFKLNSIKHTDLQRGIIEILKADPRSHYRKTKCSDRLYFFTVDNVHITAWFDDSVTPTCAEVLRVIPLSMINNTKESE